MPDSEPVDPVARLLQAFEELLPAVDSLVGHHFTRTLLQAALAHVDQVGSEDERTAVWNRLEQPPAPPAPPASEMPRAAATSDAGSGVGTATATPAPTALTGTVPS